MQCFIGIGSNLNDPLQQVLTAVKNLKKLPNTEFNGMSSCYQTVPIGPGDQPDFVNCVVGVKTLLSPWQMLDYLQEIENNQGRVRSRRWGPRIIDLDIILYGNQVLSSSRLMIPHRELKQRAFWLYPLAELAPEWVLPCGERIADLKARCNVADIISIAAKREMINE